VSLFSRRSPADDEAEHNGHAPAPGPGGEPVAGYESLKSDRIVATLRGHSQAELEAIETYERANANRQVVLDKLRYLRQNEPIEGYDELEADGVAAALEGADRATLARVREYERKFKRRDVVLTNIARASGGANGHDVPDSG
jgi:hypothetical protein